MKAALVPTALAVVLTVTACGSLLPQESEAAGQAATAASAAAALPSPLPTVSDAVTPQPVLTAEPLSPDELAGLRSREVVERGTGRTAVVPGESPAPGEGKPFTVRVEVEEGLDVDGTAFADFVLETLNDPRSWAADGLAFSRTDGDADTVVVLASPETSAQMCRPLQTFGKLSCRNGGRVVLTMYRWVHGTEEYADDLTGYRQYVVNHEVGHALGHGHVGCPVPGAAAPVMQQQTKGVAPCVPNPWPYP